MATDKNITNLQEFKGLVLRSGKVSFFKVNEKYYRMKGFTELSTSKEAQEYERTYVDETSSRTDTTGITSSTSFAFDKYTDNPVHEAIQEIFDKEKIGNDATCEMVVVDFAKPAKTAGFYALSRKYTIVADTEGDGTDAYQYSGTFKANGAVEEGTATEDTDAKDWLAIKYTKGFEPKTVSVD